MEKPIVSSVAFTKKHIVIVLVGGHTFRHKLSRYRDLLNADAKKREAWTLLEGGSVAAWPHLGRAGVTIDVHQLLWEDLCDQAMAELKVKDWKLDEIPPRAQEVVALWRLEADGYNGGF